MEQKEIKINKSKLNKNIKWFLVSFLISFILLLIISFFGKITPLTEYDKGFDPYNINYSDLSYNGVLPDTYYSGSSKIYFQPYEIHSANGGQIHGVPNEKLITIYHKNKFKIDNSIFFPSSYDNPYEVEDLTFLHRLIIFYIPSVFTAYIKYLLVFTVIIYLIIIGIKSLKSKYKIKLE